MSWELDRDVPDLEKLYARKLWLGVDHPSEFTCTLLPVRSLLIFCELSVNVCDVLLNVC